MVKILVEFFQINMSVNHTEYMLLLLFALLLESDVLVFKKFANCWVGGGGKVKPSNKPCLNDSDDYR